MSFHLCASQIMIQVEHLHWQLNKMENSRKLYELATGQLVTFLEQVIRRRYLDGSSPYYISFIDHKLQSLM